MFRYNGKIWNPKNPEKKLKQLRITWNDVEIIEESKLEELIEYNNIKLYYFKNKITGELISSVYDNLDNLCSVINVNNYERCIN